jgi:hypothetical protein
MKMKKTNTHTEKRKIKSFGQIQIIVVQPLKNGLGCHVAIVCP